MVGSREEHNEKWREERKEAYFTRGYRLTLSVEAFFDNSIA